MSRLDDRRIHETQKQIIGEGEDRTSGPVGALQGLLLILDQEVL